MATLLADELFLITLDATSGRFVASNAVVSLGLAAALIAEIGEHLDVKNDLLVVVDRRPPHDPLSHKVLDQMAGEAKSHPTHDWLAFFAQNSCAQVSDRMNTRGFIRTETRRRFLSREEIYVPTNPSNAAWPLARLRRHLYQTRPTSISLGDAFLLVTAEAIGMHQALTDNGFQDTREMARNRLKAAPQQLMDPWAHLARHVSVAIGTAIQTHRT